MKTLIGENKINVMFITITLQQQKEEFYKQPMYYALAHFTKALPEGSQRVKVDSSFSSEELPEGFSYVGFRRPDNATVLVLLNR